jgi:hypothetical protein
VAVGCEPGLSGRADRLPQAMATKISNSGTGQ